MAWNPVQYLKFKSARLRPALDLLRASANASIDPTTVKSVLDLGCGPGSVTQHICETFPNARVEGVDSSQEMIEKAMKSNYPSSIKERISFHVGTIENEIENSNRLYDVIFSNASLQWCQNHETLIPKILKNSLSQNNGILALQMPETAQLPSHQLMETAALRCGMLDQLQSVRIPRVEETATWYYQLLSPLCKEVSIWSTEYEEELEATPITHADSHCITKPRHPVLEFVKASGLLPIIRALGGESTPQCQKYLNEYDRLLQEQYPTLIIKNKYHLTGKNIVLMPFKRFFCDLQNITNHHSQCKKTVL